MGSRSRARLKHFGVTEGKGQGIWENCKWKRRVLVRAYGLGISGGSKECVGFGN